MPPIARGQTWLCQPLPVSTVPTTGRNLSNSNYRVLDGEEEQLSVQGYGNVTSMQFTGSHNRCCTVLRIPAILRHLFCRQFGNIHVDSVLLTCVQCSHCKFTRLIIADRMLVHDRSCFATYNLPKSYHDYLIFKLLPIIKKNFPDAPIDTK